MLKRPKIKILILLISIIIIGGYFFISSLIGNPKFSNLKLLRGNLCILVMSCHIPFESTTFPLSNGIINYMIAFEIIKFFIF